MKNTTPATTTETTTAYFIYAIDRDINAMEIMMVVRASASEGLQGIQTAFETAFHEKPISPLMKRISYYGEAEETEYYIRQPKKFVYNKLYPE